MLSKLAIVLALVLAAGVMFPLRRAQVALAAHAARARGSAAPRPAMRRRLLRAEIAHPSDSGCPRKHLVQLARATAGNDGPHASAGSGVSAAAGHGTGQIFMAAPWCPPDGRDKVAPPQRLTFIKPMPRSAAASQAVVETPHPPPRSAAA